MQRIAVLVVALIAIHAARARACPVSHHPCKKYMPRPEVIEEAAIGYASTVKGSIPRWSYDRIAAFLARGPWAPITGDRSEYKKAFGGRMPKVIWARPPRIVFATGEQAAEMHVNDSIVLLRRIEKQGAAILVDVDGLTFRLATCPNRAGYTCLVKTTLDFAPVTAPAP